MRVFTQSMGHCTTPEFQFVRATAIEQRRHLGAKQTANPPRVRTEEIHSGAQLLRREARDGWLLRLARLVVWHRCVDR
jgi:hypothetical protein